MDERSCFYENFPLPFFLRLRRMSFLRPRHPVFFRVGVALAKQISDPIAWAAFTKVNGVAFQPVKTVVCKPGIIPIGLFPSLPPSCCNAGMATAYTLVPVEDGFKKGEARRRDSGVAVLSLPALKSRVSRANG